MDDNFLNQFMKKDYKKEDEPKTATSSNNKKAEAHEALKKDQKASLSPLGASVKNETDSIFKAKKKTENQPFPEITAAKSNNQKIATTEHIVEKDDHYQKRKLIRYGIIGGSAFVACLAIFFITRLMNRVEIKDFVGTPIAEARTWGLTNQITLEVEEVFDLEYDENMIIDQSVEPNKTLQSGSVLQLTVSKGPDPDEIIELPDFESMNAAEVREWQQENRATNVNIREEYSEEVEQGNFIRKEFGSNAINEDNYTRKDGLIIFMSKGEEVFEANIDVPDFTKQTKEEVEKWAKEKDVDLTIEEGTSSTVFPNHIISQSIAAGEKIAKKDEITVVVSIGQSVTVPNFSNYNATEATESFADELNVIVQHRYNGSVPFGRVISQSESAGTELIKGETTPKVTVVYSLGRPYLENLIGTSEKELNSIFHDFTSQGANITYTVNYVDSSEAKGNIVSMSKYAQFMSMTDHVNISVSRGNLTPPAPAEATIPEDDNGDVE